MFTEEEFNDCLDAACALDGSSIVDGGGMAAVYVGCSIWDRGGWISKADWSNKFETHSRGNTPSEALANLTKKLKGMRDEE